jgi:hypothetical protein
MVVIGGVLVYAYGILQKTVKEEAARTGYYLESKEMRRKNTWITEIYIRRSLMLVILFPGKETNL